MEKTGEPQSGLDISGIMGLGTPHRPRVRVFSIAVRLIIAVAVVGAGIYLAVQMVGDRPEPVRRQARERSFTVAVSEATRADFRADIRTYGSITAARSIDMRAQVAGEVLEVAPGLVAGGTVKAGDMLVRIDSFNYDGALSDARMQLADARVQLTVAEEQLRLEEINLSAARDQLQLATRDLERARALLASGSLTDKAVEDRELVVSQRAQTVAQRESAMAVQAAAIERQQTAIARAQWAAEQAERAVANTRILAPFDAVVVSETLTLGRIVSSNEVIAQLYDRNALEARFTLTDREYGQLATEGVIGRPVTVTWNIGAQSVVATGTISRTAAEVNAALGGVEVFARLEPSTVGQLRAGSFVSVQVQGLTYPDAFRVPETALYEEDHLYVVEDGRMRSIDATILARDGAHLIIDADLPLGARVITTRLAQAGDGVRITIEGEATTPAPPTRSSTATPGAPAAGQDGAAARNGQRPLPEGATRNEDGSVTFANGITRRANGTMVDADGNPVQPGAGGPGGGGRQRGAGGEPGGFGGGQGGAGPR